MAASATCYSSVYVYNTAYVTDRPSFRHVERRWRRALGSRAPCACLPRSEIRCACARSEETTPIPPELQTAVDAGNVDQVTSLLAAAPPETYSKSLKKKLLKNAEIAAKKLAKGGAAAAPPPAAAAGAAAAKPPAATKKAAAPAESAAAKPRPAVQQSSGGVAGDIETELVAAMLACAESLSLSDDAVAKLRGNTAALALSLAPQVSAMRNEAYALGFNAHGSRAA